MAFLFTLLCIVAFVFVLVCIDYAAKILGYDTRNIWNNFKEKVSRVSPLEKYKGLVTIHETRWSPVSATYFVSWKGCEVEGYVMAYTRQESSIGSQVYWIEYADYYPEDTVWIYTEMYDVPKFVEQYVEAHYKLECASNEAAYRARQREKIVVANEKFRKERNL